MPVQDNPTSFIVLSPEEAALVKAVASQPTAEAIGATLGVCPDVVIRQLSALREKLESARPA